MKRILPILAVLLPFFTSAQTLCEMGMAGPYPCENIDLMSHLPTATFGAGIEFNDIWGWTDPLDGKEYALLGVTNATAFIDISDPVNPVYLGTLPTQTVSSLWRDIKTYGNYAFIVSEAGGHGMQVFDLTRLRSVVAPPETFTADALYTGFGNAHNIVINPDVPRAYAVGTNTFSGGLHIVNIADPLNPVIAGDFAEDGYTHDAQVVTYSGPDASYQGLEIAFACNEDELTIVNVNDPTDCQLISATGYTGSAYCHQGWLSPDQQYFYSNDELDESQQGIPTRTLVWDVSDLDNPVLIGDFDAAINAIDHNLYTDGNLIYEANYRGGLRILDATDSATPNLSEVAHFDLYPSSNSAAFNGAWSNYPYFASGNVVVSHIEEGLFVLRPQFLQASNIPTIAQCSGDPIVIDLEVEDGFAGPVNFATVGLDPTVSVDFALNGIGPGSNTATINTPAGTNATYTFTITATGAHFTYSWDVEIEVVDCANAVFGCTDPEASNFDPAATVDDGSCIYPCLDVTFTLMTDCWGNEVSWELTDDAGTTVATNQEVYGNQQTFTEGFCLTPGCYTFTIFDSFGDGLNGTSAGCAIDGSYNWSLDADGSIIIQMLTSAYGSSETQQFCLIYGCTDPTTCNYNPDATIDDGSCSTGCQGCTDVNACNYDANATVDDGSCEFTSCAGCTDDTACNYDPTATLDNGACEFTSCAGCTDDTACNYDPTATLDNGACEFTSCAGCTDDTACNYDPSATLDNGSCEFTSCAGCTDDTACNYDPSATLDNGSCEFTSCANNCIEDLNNDGSVGVADLLVVLGEFGCTENCVADLNNDGQVGTADILQLVGVFGVPCEE